MVMVATLGPLVSQLPLSNGDHSDRSNRKSDIGKISANGMTKTPAPPDKDQRYEFGAGVTGFLQVIGTCFNMR